MYTVYVISNLDKIYIGYTSDINSRLARHNGIIKNKRTSFTYKNNKATWVLIYTEKFEIKKEALRREKELKSFRGREFIRTLIKT